MVFRTAGVPPAHEKSGQDARGPHEYDPVAEDGDTYPAELGRRNESNGSPGRMTWQW